MQSVFRRILFLVLLGFLVLVFSLFFQGLWAALVVTNLKTSPAIPWSVALMALVLWLAWQYAGGNWSPRSTAARRQRYLRPNWISPKTFCCALFAGTLSIIALAGSWIVIFQLAQAPGNRLPDFSKYPFVTVVLVITMAAIVGAVVEEAGFRGYFQVALERDFSASVAIVISALLVMPAHGLTQGFFWPTLLWYFFVDVMLGLMAYLTNSILPGILIHGAGLLIFFGLVWPADRSRLMVNNGGADRWFWIHIGQAIIFTLSAILAFRGLASMRTSSDTVRSS